MASKWWLGRKFRKAPSPKSVPPRLEKLEEIVAPSVSIGSVSIVPDNPATPTFVREGETATLTVQYTAVDPIGNLNLVIDWGDNPGNPSAPVPPATNPEIISVLPGVAQTVTIQHRYRDDNPTGTPTDLATVSVKLVDSGPSVIVNKDNTVPGNYDAYDVPGIKMNLGDAFAAAPATSGVNPVAALDGNSNVAAAVNLGGTFRFMGSDFTNVNVTKNGQISFNGSNTNTTGSLTSTTAPAIIAPMWRNLTTGAGPNSRVFTKIIFQNDNTTPGWFAIEWHNVFAGGATTGPNGVTFQVLLQLGTGTTNGDIIFNYRNTTFGNAAIDFGVGSQVGIKSGGTAQTGNTVVTPSRRYSGNGQAIRFSVRDVAIGQISGPNSFGYASYRMPYESNLLLSAPTILPTPSNGNFNLLGPGGFTNQVFSIDATTLGTNSFTFYGVVRNAASGIAGTGYGLVTFVGSDNSPTNTNLVSAPTQAAIATLWDEWVGQNAPAQVMGRVIDADGDGVGEYLVIQWRSLPNAGVTTVPAPTATWQAIFQLNTGSNDQGNITLNYVNTDLGNAAFNSGGSATVGIKNSNTAPAGSDPLVVSFNQTNNTNLANNRAVGIFQLTSLPVSTTIRVDNVAPTYVASTLAAGSVNEGVAFTRTVQFIDPSGQDLAGVVQPGWGDFFTVQVNWGDGSPVQNITINPGDRSFDLSHVYRDDGTNTPGFGNYTITLSNFVDDDTGAITPNATIPITVFNVAPTLTITTPPRLVFPGQPLVLQGPAPSDQIAGFTDPGVSYAPTGGGSGTRETFTAVVDWGDGSPIETVVLPVLPPPNPSVGGSVTPATPLTAAQPYTQSTGTIFGQHRFLGVGTFTVTVTLRDDDTGSSTQTLLVSVGNENVYMVGAGAGSGPLVTVYNSALHVLATQFYAYETSFRGGVRVAAGHINGDRLADYVTAPGNGGGPLIKVYDGVTNALQDSFFAYDSAFRGGCYVAVADINGDGFDDIITGAGEGGGAHVKVFSGRDRTLLFNNVVYNPAFRGGVRVAGGDVNGDGFADIITAPGIGGGPHIQVFSGRNGALLYSFMAYEPEFRGGVFVASGDITGDGKADVIVGPGQGGGPHLKVFDVFRNRLAYSGFPYPAGNPVPPSEGPITAPTLWQTGLRVGVTDYNRDGRLDIVVGPGSDQQSYVKILDGVSFAEVNQFLAFDPTFLGGVFVAGN